MANATLRVYRDPPLDGPTNMARDECLLYSAEIGAAADGSRPAANGSRSAANGSRSAADERSPAALRLYAWAPPTISLGCFQRFAAVAELPAEVRGLPIVRRPTGGGAILHDREITYCLVLDDSIAAARQSPVALYRVVHECWRAAIVDWRHSRAARDDEYGARKAPAPRSPERAPDSMPRALEHARVSVQPGRELAPDSALPAPELAPDSMPLPSPRSGPFFCFEKPGRTDLLLGDRKLLGSAQRRIPGRVLQHGSLLLEQRFASHPGVALEPTSPEDVEWLADSFIRELTGRLGLTPLRGDWSDEQRLDSVERRLRFASDEWTRRH